MNTLSTPYQHVNFLPFVGQRYGIGSTFGLPVLILGESHYGPTAKFPEYTIDVVNEYREGDSNLPFFTKVIQAVQGGFPDRSMRLSFWDEVAYYVFVQEGLAKPKERPTEDMWAKAIPAFEEVCAVLKPGLVLACGKETWDQLPFDSGPGPDVSIGTGEVKPTCIFKYGGVQTLAFHMAHPASFGWTAAAWHPWIVAVLETAKKLREGL
jgi:hypothetical protein